MGCSYGIYAGSVYSHDMGVRKTLREERLSKEHKACQLELELSTQPTEIEQLTQLRSEHRDRVVTR